MRKANDSSPRLGIDPITCQGHGLCIEAFPERVGRDPWGYPVLSQDPIPSHLMRHAERAVAVCPVLALRITSSAGR